MRALGVIFSNIHEKDIMPLTARRTLASVPFGGRYRLIDFVLSNMTNSGIIKAGVITKANYQSLMQHLESGKNWDLSRKNGGLYILPPFGVDDNKKLYSSRMEALSNSSHFIRNTDEDVVVMSDCDNVCNIDFGKVLEYHERNAADITVIYRKKDLGENDGKFRTVFDLADDGRIKRAYVEKRKGVQNVYTNMVVINRELLLRIIERGVVHFTRQILDEGAAEYRIFGYRFDGYFAGIDSLPNYYKHSMELLNREVSEELFYSGGAHIYTKVRDSAPCMFGSQAYISNSIIADGCEIEGEVSNSILFRGVKIKRGVKVIGSILFQNTTVESGSTLNCVIADKDARILEGRLLSGHETQPFFVAKGSTI